MSPLGVKVYEPTEEVALDDHPLKVKSSRVGPVVGKLAAGVLNVYSIGAIGDPIPLLKSKVISKTFGVQTARRMTLSEPTW